MKQDDIHDAGWVIIAGISPHYSYPFVKNENNLPKYTIKVYKISQEFL